ncbi:MAG: bifunctional phosphopantothenoylcysteine decarboxylase/phosphopantothenate--cysteine ligase CoaBC [Bacteroidia bacterium]
MPAGKKILIGISGSIAAYKICWLVRDLVRSGADVQVVLTPSAQQFVTPLTLSTLSGKPVYSHLVKNEEGEWVNHVALGLWADLILVAPCTAHTLASMAQGSCDHLLLAILLSARCPVAFAPAMDHDMFCHPATQENIRTLTERGYHLIPTENGELASGLVGEGRMAEPSTLLAWIQDFLVGGPRWDGTRVLLTAGPTREALDPVRYISNRSSGRMGIALAEALADRGAQVDLVYGPGDQVCRHPGIRVHRVQTALEMQACCEQLNESCSLLIFAAAVADYRAAEVSENKIKKSGDELLLTLVPNPDLLAEAGKNKKPHQKVVGFALESQNEEANALSKLQTKKADMMVLNSLRQEGGAMDAEAMSVRLLFAEHDSEDLPRSPKRALANEILRAITQRWGLPQGGVWKKLGVLVGVLWLALAPVGSQAQELNCQLSINPGRVGGADQQFYANMQQALTTFINGQKWTDDVFSFQERINCSINIMLDERITGNQFKATVQIQSSRPVYNSSYSTVILNYTDPDWIFEYNEFQPMEFNENQHSSNLLALLAYYANLIIGLDYNTFGKESGTVYLRKAQQIVMNAQNAVEIGWRQNQSLRNRYWLSELLNNPAYKPFHAALYEYHRLGLDQMYKPERVIEARRKMLAALEKIHDVNRSKPGGMLIPIYLKGKLPEIVGFCAKALPAEKAKVVEQLIAMDPINQAEYNRINAAGVGGGPGGAPGTGGGR